MKHLHSFLLFGIFALISFGLGDLHAETKSGALDGKTFVGEVGSRGDSRGDADTGAGYYKVTLDKSGYEKVEVELVGKVNRAYLANVMNAGIGMITVDPYTGAKWTLTPMEINPHLILTGK